MTPFAQRRFYSPFRSGGMVTLNDVFAKYPHTSVAIGISNYSVVDMAFKPFIAMLTASLVLALLEQGSTWNLAIKTSLHVNAQSPCATMHCSIKK